MNRIRLLRASHGARVFLLHSPLFALCVYTTPLSHFIELNSGTLCFPPPPLTSNWLQQIAAPPLSSKRLLFLKIGDFKKANVSQELSNINSILDQRGEDIGSQLQHD